MKATIQPDICDVTEDEDVPKAFIEGVNKNLIPLAEFNYEEVELTAKEESSPIPVIIAGINQSKPEIIDSPNIHIPGTNHIPIKLEQPIQTCLPPTTVAVLHGSQIPIIDIILNSAGIMSIQQHTHSRGRIELYFNTNHTGYFLFSCQITPQLLEPAAWGIPDEAMGIKRDSQRFRKRSSLVWADMSYGILSTDHEWSPLQRIAISILELATIVSLPVLVVAGGTRFLLLVQDLYKDINGEALIRESLRHAYCFLKSTSEHWPRQTWFMDLDNTAVGYQLGKCY
ncbi:hypothetical protein V494_05046 [Pseudogymnoascus sp. VKM F-4513 (FW-928)]|nr:hypothetical protein V494_05046 [Pseudogymnoascus sp. VKM F-4513 (FW-928)]